MPYFMKIRGDLRLVVARASGPIDLESSSAFRRELEAHPDFRPDFDQILDFRLAVGSLPDFEGLRFLASTDPFSRGSRRAFLVAGDLLFGLVRTYGALQEGSSEVRPFRSAGEACAWLGVPADVLEEAPVPPEAG
jgi:hypothetical protein